MSTLAYVLAAMAATWPLAYGVGKRHGRLNAEYAANQVLDRIQRKLNLVISHISSGTRYSVDQKIHSMELFVGAVEQELALAKGRWLL